ncbi:MAG: hypothetical protein HY694_12370 [Deltaproteobacteria bacterium]|nr:hypothetical protein [Deltaproteobacteria bacterium]
MQTVNIALVGVGNCAASLVQGLQYYQIGESDRSGLTNPICAGYKVSDVRVAAAFDVNTSKIGKDLSEAIWASPNNALKFADVPHLGVLVHDGTLSDGVGRHCAGRIDASGVSTLDKIAAHLRATNTHIVVNFLPVGAQKASELYAEAAILAKCAFVNCMPATIARSSMWEGKFKSAGLPLLGDDLKSQFGSTLIHHALIDVLLRNGVDLKTLFSRAYRGRVGRS